MLECKMNMVIDWSASRPAYVVWASLVFAVVSVLEVLDNSILFFLFSVRFMCLGLLSSCNGVSNHQNIVHIPTFFAFFCPFDCRVSSSSESGTFVHFFCVCVCSWPHCFIIWFIWVLCSIWNDNLMVTGSVLPLSIWIISLVPCFQWELMSPQHSSSPALARPFQWSHLHPQVQYPLCESLELIRWL